jgi:hypothetical protein
VIVGIKDLLTKFGFAPVKVLAAAKEDREETCGPRWSSSAQGPAGIDAVASPAQGRCRQPGANTDAPICHWLKDVQMREVERSQAFAELFEIFDVDARPFVSLMRTLRRRRHWLFLRYARRPTCARSQPRVGARRSQCGSSYRVRNPSGFCGMSNVSKSDFAFTVAAARLSATIEIRSSRARNPQPRSEAARCRHERDR